MKKLVSIALLLSLAIAAVAQNAPKKYDIKSGIAKMKTSVMGQAIESTIYFDNYGDSEATRTKTAVPGAGEIEVITISKDGKTVSVIPSMKSVQEQPNPETINYSNLTDETIAKYKIKEVGKETVLGKECTKYTAENSQQGMTAASTVWVYKGFLLKSITSVSGMELVVEAVEFAEDAFVLPETFAVPTF